MAKTPLEELADHGQSVWIDYLSRPFVLDGDLAGLVEQGIKGVTSNPTIFQGAIAEGDAYDDQIREIVSSGEKEPKEIFIRLAADDIRDACDVLRPVHDEGGGKDGYVSLEVDPNLAHDTQGTIEEAKHLHGLIDKPNVFIKIPATKEGLPAIEETIAAGIPVNVTLIFSLERHRAVAEAYVRGAPAPRRLGRRPLQGRLRRLVLRLARRHGGRQAPGRARRPRRAEGQARDRQRQARLRAVQGGLLRREVGGAPRQGRHGAALPVGVDLDQEPRVPRRDLRRGARRPGHGQHDAARHRRGGATTTARSATASRRTSTAPARCSTTSKAAGIDYDDVVDTLEKEGVQKFADSFKELFADIESKRDQLVAA